MKLKNFNFNQKVQLQPDQIHQINSNLRPFPITIEIDLTNHCNHRCSFCVWGEHISTDKSSLIKENLCACKSQINLKYYNYLKYLGENI